MEGLVESRYWAKVNRPAATSCWLWTGAKTPAGYGKLRIRRATCYAHHIALHLDGRPRPDGAIALHSCDDPSCVNPQHLAWGDQAANMQDAIRKGRAPHHGRAAGRKNGNAKLSEGQVADIRGHSGTQAQIAEEFGVSRSLVSQIRARTAWRHM